LSAVEKSQGEDGMTSAPEKTTHEVQHLCQLAQLSRAGYYRHLAPSETRRDDADIRDAIHRAALFDRFYGYRKRMRSIRWDNQAFGAGRARRQLQAGASVDAAR
jgi:hypothetical protein